ncbi:hypothetical protein M011DRAFT_90580 [Sporormia fimetaria CBS 119925]|uniref:Uncharacterized protein n=1 Tax=Sporormia fimetaria CBS 119925 TaxID=1340428 RepID=A0A6A6V6F1_9PLEO|nr:hypothetical protein M011DRAFT_90580 [Sporormia fimetaria CBS 119925]
MNSSTRAFAVVTLTALGSLYLLLYAPFASHSMPQQSASGSDNGIPGLGFTVSQVSYGPPTLQVTLKNDHPSSTFTILRWATPLDPQALNLGIFKLVDADTGTAINTDIIKVGRKMPPPKEDLLELQSGAENTVEVVFDKPWMPNRKPASYKVWIEGEFHGVWEKPVREVSEQELEDYTGSPLDGRNFRSEQVELRVQ